MSKKKPAHDTQETSSSISPEKESMSTESSQSTLAKEKESAEKYLANWQRAQADFENYKKRNIQEREGVIKFANAVLVLSLLPIIDDMERALSSIPSNLKKLSWVDGINLIYHKFKATLENQGLAEIKASGGTFDPMLHEAVMHGEGEEGKVIDVTQKGYTLNGKLLRPAMVVVGSGENDKPKEPEE